MDLKQMSKVELKRYLSKHRNDDEKFSEALKELMNRDPNPTWYPPTNWEETEKILKSKLHEI